jgi:hypothetical protein
LDAPHERPLRAADPDQSGHRVDVAGQVAVERAGHEHETDSVGQQGSGCVAPATGGQIILVSGRLAIKVKGMLYEFLDNEW